LVKKIKKNIKKKMMTSDTEEFFENIRDELPIPVISMAPKRKRKTPEIKTEFKTKKRKKELAPDSPSTKRMRTKCKADYTTSSTTLDPTMMKKFDTWSKKKLEEWILLNEFKQGKQQQANFAKSLLHIYSLVLDKVSKGAGEVASRLQADKELERSFEEELGSLWVLFSNKIKIAILSASDVLTAKIEQRNSQDCKENKDATPK
jgi:hypothetical protein